MTYFKKLTDGIDSDGSDRAWDADAEVMQIEEVQGELEPGEAVFEQDMEVEADLKRQESMEKQGGNAPKERRKPKWKTQPEGELEPEDYYDAPDPGEDEGVYPETYVREQSHARRSRRRDATHTVDDGEDYGSDFAEREAARSGEVRKEAVGEKTVRNEAPVKNRRASGGSGKKTAIIAACVLTAITVAGGSVYAVMAQKYKTVFFPNTTINGMDASGHTVAEMKEMIAGGIDQYVLTIEERGDKKEQLTGEEMGLRAKFDGGLEQLVTTQNPYAWLGHRFKPSEHTISTMIEYDEDVLGKAAEGLECMDPSAMKEPENARISDYVPGQGYSIIPEEEGTKVQNDVLLSSLKDSIMNLREVLSLEEAGVYQAPEILADNAALTEQLAAMNRCVSTTVTYKFGDKKEVLNGDRIHEWLVTDEAGNVSVDSTQAAEYVEELAAAYNTANKAKNLKTSTGQTIQVKGGTYGWKINQSEEAAQLAAILKSGESQEREPVYSQKAASHGENDYGDSYVEINLTAQHLYLYKNGSLVVDSDFVSGNLSKGWGTPAGTYPLNYKQRNATLKGENYRTPVDYWMPFNGGIGMHDANWRNAFGGTLYKTGGSHGCINLPPSVAKKIYENIDAGMPVICYNLAGTEKGSSSTVTPPTEAATQAPAETPAPTPTESAAQMPTQPPAQTPTQAPTQAPETMAPAGPGSDNGQTGGGSGPGAGL